ncbi:acyltransferase family protein [Pedobacter rhizosphaerae]|uniref:Peptidoglycan/LPS O-acetylase OafA/YrhL, contains acyltransferase and SGNH-hydrolase domains n=1 Tax=Pedobacter rhizosphaerae TaxID=390241 RepID=A0A1H9N6V0_9SPHI|nr:acyltransferase [Pedobacter rhizosphaerae]SER31399.1 Peptidoglycan/LPS O-acetylase OafA/YrhL, contains acyltransferase and SGNH-hydrolase domains [Pedobacter rhizosphaerae]
MKQASIAKNDRIIALDGFRALAAIGVLYIHCWSSFGNPQINLFGIDFSKILAIGGNGVDLFFVISGFIMYTNYGTKSFSVKKFLIKRWVRLSPAFYVASVLYILMAYLKNKDFPIVESAFTSIFYLNNILSKYNSAGLFWTLSLEWQYYLLFPIFTFFQNLKNFRTAFLLFSGIFIIIPLIVTFFLPSSTSLFTDQIIFRFFEFAFGMLAGRLFMNDQKQKNINMLLIFPLLFIVYAGRFLISKNILDLFLTYGSVFKWLGFSIMGLGFAAILYWGLHQKWLSNFFKFTGLAYLGKLSYSFYLWHGLAIIFIAQYFASYPSYPIVQVFSTFTTSLLILFPISFISYHYLEKPFLRSKK